ncbi:HAD family phosphatase [uncultured Flavobacterium sp.]|uniref:HAD family hydrolase n=1 Tax=uncultured Flavobacterium sp. TaxID=165435 RepID=UPI0030C83CAE
MIDTIIFDFGDIFINLDKPKVEEELRKIGLAQWNDTLNELNHNYEIGQISENEFLTGFQQQIPTVAMDEIKKAWNSILADFPLYRLEFLEDLTSKYKLFLLSNTDFTHIEEVKRKVGSEFHNRFINCFEKVYYSFEMGMRKPDESIYQFVIEKHQLNPNKTLFVDDKNENTNAAQKLGLQVWNLQVGKEDVIELQSFLNSNL